MWHSQIFFCFFNDLSLFDTVRLYSSSTAREVSGESCLLLDGAGGGGRCAATGETYLLSSTVRAILVSVEVGVCALRRHHHRGREQVVVFNGETVNACLTTCVERRCRP